jgi:hypothetical protein
MAASNLLELDLRLNQPRQVEWRSLLETDSAFGWEALRVRSKRKAPLPLVRERI